MKSWDVTIPIAGHAYLTIEADSEEEAIEKALDTVRLSDIGNWEGLRQFPQDICHCPSPWEAEAEQVYDSEFDGEE